MDDSLAVAKGASASDVICIRSYRGMSSTEFLAKFQVNTKGSISQDKLKLNFYINKTLCHRVVDAVLGNDGTLNFLTDGGQPHFPPSETLELLCLQEGLNEVSCGNNSFGFVSFSIFLWETYSRLVIVDIDGTLTRSSVRGYVETVFLGTYKYIHAGVVSLILFLHKMGLKFVYLTARPWDHMEETRSLLKNISEHGNYLPPGPLFTHRGGRMTTLFMELVSDTTADFKHSVLKDIANTYRRALSADCYDLIRLGLCLTSSV